MPSLTPGQKPAAPAEAGEAQPAGADTTEHPVPGHSYDFHTDQWAELYVKRIDAMIAALKSKGVPVLWVGLPALRGPKSTSDMAYLDELYRERAERAGISYVDIWDGFTDDQGRYAVDGPDFEGQIRRLRTADGVHFTKAGAVKLASYVDQELRRVMSNHIAPVALPEQAVPIKPGTAHPDVGPVLPLTVSSSNNDGGTAAGTGGLLGAGSDPAPLASDPLAQKVLDRGAPIAAVAGRADDFSWPRPQAPADFAPQPVSLSPAAPAKKGAAAHDDAKKPADAKKDAKKKPERDSDAAKDRHSPRATLDGAPIPPAPSDRARGSATLVPADSMEGGCTCRQVRYRLTGRPLIVHACHCRWCQRETGTVHALNALYEADRVVHTAGEPEIIAIGKRKRPEHRALSCLQGRRLEQLPAGWTRRPLRAGRHVGSARSMPARHPHLHVVEADLGDAPDGRKGVPEFYDLAAVWPAESLERLRIMRERGCPKP